MSLSRIHDHRLEISALRQLPKYFTNETAILVTQPSCAPAAWRWSAFPLWNKHLLHTEELARPWASPVGNSPKASCGERSSLLTICSQTCFVSCEGRNELVPRKPLDRCRPPQCSGLEINKSQQRRNFLRQRALRIKTPEESANPSGGILMSRFY